jgi:hypothetical protein
MADIPAITAAKIKLRNNSQILSESAFPSPAISSIFDPMRAADLTK